MQLQKISPFLGGLVILVFLFSCQAPITAQFQTKSTVLTTQHSNPKSADPTAFISVWDTHLYCGVSMPDQISLPLGPSGTYNFIVDWGDGNFDTITIWNQTEKTHTYADIGVYTITITGTIIGWSFGWDFNPSGDYLKILEISQWGCLQLGNDGLYFNGCKNLVLTTTDILNLTGTSSMQWTFASCSSLGTTGNLASWDVSQVVDMSYMFYEATAFNQPISIWNVSLVTDMSFMFYKASTFNQPIGSWDVSQVTSMFYMFNIAHDFNQPLGDWNVSQVIEMSSMFSEASLFNQPIGDWDVSHVLGMDHIFYNAYTFNQSIGGWNVSQVTNMHSMFELAQSFNQPIGDWNVSQVTNMQSMFDCAYDFNQPIGDWNVSQVTNMQKMFSITSFNQSIGNWDVSQVVDMSYMFYSDITFNQPLGDWNVSQVTNMQSMFEAAKAFDQPLGSWNISQVTNMIYMIHDYGYSKCLSSENYDQTLNGWAQLNLQSNVTFDAGKSRYSRNGVTARQSIIDSYNWTIIDGGIQHLKPTPPQSFQASPGSKTIYLSWMPPSDNGGSPIIWYLIYYKSGYGSKYDSSHCQYLTANTFNCSFSTPLMATTYYFVITAKNAIGESEYSNEVSSYAYDTTTTTTTTSSTSSTTLSTTPTSTDSTNNTLSNISGYNVFLLVGILAITVIGLNRFQKTLSPRKFAST